MIVQLDYILETDADPVILNLILDVTETCDPYGTGDSPTQLEVAIEKCTASDGGFYDFSIMHKYDVYKISKLACDKYRG